MSKKVHARDMFAAAMHIDIGEEDCVACTFNNNRDLAQQKEILDLRAELAEQKIRTRSALDLAGQLIREKRSWIGMCCLIGAIALMALGQACGWVKP
jgi:hypothetical protein